MKRVQAGVVGCAVIVASSAAAFSAADLYRAPSLRTWFREEAFPIRSVRVGGHLEHVRPESIEAALAPFVKEGFLGVDVDAAARAASDLPWVARASVRRVWPDRLRVAVIEREAVARWGRPDGPARLLAVDGTVFDSPGSGGAQRLPRLSGPRGEAPLILRAYHRAVRSVDGVGGGVAELALSDRGVWTLVCRNGMRIVFGEDQIGRLGQLARLFQPLLGNRATRVASIDLRYPNGFAVRWKSIGP